MVKKKRKDMSEHEILQQMIGDQSVGELYGMRKLITTGLSKNDPKLNKKNGTYILKCKDKVMYVGSAVNKLYGVETRITQILSNTSTGAQHYSAEKIRKNADALELWFIPIKRGLDDLTNANKLKRLLIALLKPAWHDPMPPEKRIAAFKAGHKG